MRVSKVVAVVALVVFSLALITSLCVFVAVTTIYKKINFDADEVLFEHSADFSSTTFYAEGEDGEPCIIETSGALKKMHYGLDEMSQYIKDGIVAVEDKKFYDHSGVDIKRTMLAASNYLLNKGKSFGASTITQQVVKNISGDNEQKLSRKLAEILRAFHIEKHYTKNEILEVYLNIIPLSENIYGVGAASRVYFGKEPSELLPEEAAMLIGLTNAPTAYNPYNHPDACLKKRNVVLSVMHADGLISDAEYGRAVNTPLNVIKREHREDRYDSWFVETAIAEISRDLARKYDITPSAAEIMLLSGGYKVYTTMEIAVQKVLEEYFSDKNNFPAEIGDGLNYAMTVTDSETGNLVGIVGRVGKKRANKLLNHALIPHTPGSVLKPIALYAPLIETEKINWASVFDDVPVEFIESSDTIKPYPRNSPDVYDGLITVKDAVTFSKNTVAVKLCRMLGAKNIFNSLRDNYGFESLVEGDSGLSDIATAPMALGQLTRGVSLFRLTEAYSVFPSEGIRKEAKSYTRLVDYRGEEILGEKKNEKRILSEETSRIMNQLLMNVTGEGTARGLELKKNVDLAGKTGTSGNNRDKLFIGYTPYYTAGIWCGYENGGREVKGLSKGHLQIWDEIMCQIHLDKINKDEKKNFSTDGLVYMPYCRDSGQLFDNVCTFDPRGDRRDFGYFKIGSQPSAQCTRHIMCAYDSVTKAIACPDCPKENLVGVALIHNESRAFPIEINISDAEYVYRDISGYLKRPIDFALPYFYYSIPDGVYVGRSKSKKQFNSNCYIHDH